MSGQTMAENDKRRDLLRTAHAALDTLEACLVPLSDRDASPTVDLVVQLRREIIVQFGQIEAGARTESDAP